MKLRRYQNNLITSSSGLMYITVWQIIYVVGLFHRDYGKYFAQAKGETAVDFEEWAFNAALVLVLGVIFAFSFLWNLIIASSASAVGHNKKRSPLYLVMSAITLLIHVVPIPLQIGTLLVIPDSISYLDNLSGFTVNLITTFISADILFSASRIRSLKNKISTTAEINDINKD